jgi:hypothetical protein
VCAGDPDDASACNGASERFGSLCNRNSELTRARKLGMIPGHRRCNDQLAHTFRVLGAMSLDDTDSEDRQIFRRARIGVAPRNSDTAPREELGERAHSGAGDPDEMNRALVRAID